jgi:(2Fe-2S) ferredoxin
MKYIVKLFIVTSIVTICLTACNKDPYMYYIAEGRIIDKITREPVEGIMVSSYRYDNLLSSERHSPPEYDTWSDTNGKFIMSQKHLYSQLYFYGYYNGLYTDTIISVDFSTVTLSGTPHKNYKGDYILYIEDVELEKTN